MNLAATIAKMKACGMSADAIVQALECIVIDDTRVVVDEQAERRRAADRERKARKRSVEVCGHSAESADNPSPLVPPLSPAPLTPPIIPPTRTPSARGAAQTGEESLAFDAYNDLASELGLAKAQALTDERRSKIRQRLNECGGLTGWLDALGKIRGSPFLRGDNDRGWKASLDFLLQRSSFTRLMEGSYERSDARQRTSTASRPTIRDGFAILDAVTDEAIRRSGGLGEEGGEEDFGWIPGLRKSAA